MSPFRPWPSDSSEEVQVKMVGMGLAMENVIV